MMDISEEMKEAIIELIRNELRVVVEVSHHLDYGNDYNAVEVSLYIGDEYISSDRSTF